MHDLQIVSNRLHLLQIMLYVSSCMPLNNYRELIVNTEFIVNRELIVNTELIPKVQCCAPFTNYCNPQIQVQQQICPVPDNNIKYVIVTCPTLSIVTNTD